MSGVTSLHDSQFRDAGYVVSCMEKALTQVFTSNKPDLVNEASGKVMLMSLRRGGMWTG